MITNILGFKNMKENRKTQINAGIIMIGFCILLHVIAAINGIIIFRYPEGAYFAILPERIMMIFICQFGVIISLIISIIGGKGFEKIINFFLGFISCFTSYFLYKAIEVWAFKIMNYID